MKIFSRLREWHKGLIREAVREELDVVTNNIYIMYSEGFNDADPRWDALTDRHEELQRKLRKYEKKAV